MENMAANLSVSRLIFSSLRDESQSGIPPRPDYLSCQRDLHDSLGICLEGRFPNFPASRNACNGTAERNDLIRVDNFHK